MLREMQCAPSCTTLDDARDEGCAPGTCPGEAKSRDVLATITSHAAACALEVATAIALNGCVSTTRIAPESCGAARRDGEAVAAEIVDAESSPAPPAIEAPPRERRAPRRERQDTDAIYWNQASRLDAVPESASAPSLEPPPSIPTAFRVGVR